MGEQTEGRYVTYRSVNGRPTLWDATALPDDNPFPLFELLPLAVSVDRLASRARIGAQVAAQRVRGAWVVLRGGEPLSDEGTSCDGCSCSGCVADDRLSVGMARPDDPGGDDMSTAEQSDERPTTYWCKDHTGRITERVTTGFEGHRGHVLCIPIDRAAAPEPV